MCGKQMLLLLDNFEHVLPAAPYISDLLEACTKIKILVTSRASLHLRAEKELPIQPLTVPPLGERFELQPLSQYSSVQLFIQRCQGVKADFQVTNKNASAIAEICHRLDGLPLAIELAAARIKLLPPHMLLSRLERRFEVLRGGTKDLPSAKNHV
jgi:predicted ATPase